MADRIDVEVTGKSKYEVAYQMARLVLVEVERKELKSISRQEYMRAVSEAITVLNGGWPYP